MQGLNIAAVEIYTKKLILVSSLSYFLLANWSPQHPHQISYFVALITKLYSFIRYITDFPPTAVLSQFTQLYTTFAARILAYISINYILKSS